MVMRDGQQLGDYRLIQSLGKSETAEIYLGEHIFLETQAVLKILQVSLPEQDVPVFLQEAHTLIGLIHPNIVRMLDVGVQDETLFLVMEYVTRGSLRQNYPPGTRLSPASIVSLVKQIANALQYAHDQNIIHGNIKSENILLGIDSEVLLSDFGIVTLLQARNVLRKQHLIPETSAYMAPEQLVGKPQQASDQYALAVIVYEWSVGTYPFQDSNVVPGDQHLQVRTTTVQGISPEIDNVLNIALERDPARRFRSIRAFARALESAYDNRAGEAISTISKEIPPLLDATVPAFPSPIQDVAYQPQDVIQSDEFNISVLQRDTDTDQSQESYYVHSTQKLFLQPELSVPNKGTSRRVFLAGIGGGVLVIGGVVALFASGKLSTLFTKATPQHTPGRSIITRPTPVPIATATQSTLTVTPTQPLGTTLTTYTGQSTDVTGVCWSPTVGNRIVASCSQDGSAAIWDATTGETTRTFPQSGPLSTLVWSPDGQYIAFGGDASIVNVWDAASGTLISTCTGHTQPIRGLAWSPDSQRIVSTSQDHTAIVWNAATGNRLITFTGHTDYVWVAAWAPNGSSIATGGWDSTVQIWNPDTGVLILRYVASQFVRALDWSPDSSLIASGGNDNTVQVWQAANGNVMVTYRGHSDHIETVQWSPDGQRIASASKDTTAQIWQASNVNQIYTYRGHSQTVWSLAWSPDGQLIVSGSRDHTVKVWQAT